MTRSSRHWLSLHLGLGLARLGLAWIALVASRAPTGSCHGATGSQVLVMLLLACSAYVPLLARAGQRAEATNVTTM